MNFDSCLGWLGKCTFMRADGRNATPAFPPALACVGPSTRPNWAALCLSVPLLMASQGCAATDIYASTDADGMTRWSTQALDSSYSRAMTVSPASPVATGVSFLKGKGQGAAHAHKLQERRRHLLPLVVSVAHRFGVDTEIVMALIEVESAFDTWAVSPKGARGLMQLMPATAAGYGVREAKDLHDPARNLEVGVRHLKKLLALHGGQWALTLAAYNAGQGAVARHGQRIPGYFETMLYVPAVMAKAARFEAYGQLAPVLLRSAE